ncbi:DUF4259 domain-containing protein [Thaumasiovibrio subtropicus]|uniref:DUF4259 domain-containing protein n=1 Tax=Thaumasiovibrio subtropicus TaxID=1891207 RepID=UPI00131B541D|nr:DUF4259 domain-containing protein [Thaumasiovibrio subtropicus]
MGAWGTGNFDNDTACDWAFQLEESDDLSLIESTIDEVFEEDYIDADVGSEALAAIDTLARLRGIERTKNAYTEAVDKWVANHPIATSEPLILRASEALIAIASEESELSELWSETDEYDAWRQEIDSLIKAMEKH